MIEVKVGQRWLYCSPGGVVAGRWNIIEITKVWDGTKCAAIVAQLGPNCDWVRLGQVLGGEDVSSLRYTYLEGQDKP